MIENESPPRFVRRLRPQYFVRHFSPQHFVRRLRPHTYLVKYHTTKNPRIENLFFFEQYFTRYIWYTYYI